MVPSLVASAMIVPTGANEACARGVNYNSVSRATLYAILIDPVGSQFGHQVACRASQSVCPVPRDAQISWLA